MTIKQHGGVFGRNPTFNNLTVDGSLSVKSGIDFSSNSNLAGMASETLSDFERGTFTATLTGATTAPTTPATATGYYTKIDELVNVRLWFQNVDTTGGSGNMQVTGLPFASRSEGSAGRTIAPVLSFGLDVPGLYNVAFLDSNTTTLDFFSMVDDGAWLSPQLTAGAGRYLSVNITYMTAS